jgi:hypothetical protein
MGETTQEEPLDLTVRMCPAAAPTSTGNPFSYCFPATTVGRVATAKRVTASGESLDLRNNRLSHKVVVSFAEALANNHRLRELKLDLCYKRIGNLTSDGLAAFNRVLCDNTSIMTTYYSNHTLERIFGDTRELPFDVEL